MMRTKMVGVVVVEDGGGEVAGVVARGAVVDRL